ncbi:hypothetical protein M3Y94_01071600 [Aphelenchoides besseyi]|nr:hypothetical protein M3Y94_01071600 [Aphelenchoides besseyi]
MVSWTLPIGSDNLADFFATLSVGVDVPFQWIQQLQRRVVAWISVQTPDFVIDDFADWESLIATLSVGPDVCFQWLQIRRREQVLIDSDSVELPVKLIVTLPTQSSNSNSESATTRKTQMAIREKHVPGVTQEDLSDNTLRNVKDIPSIQSDVPSIDDKKSDDSSDPLAESKNAEAKR